MAKGLRTFHSTTFVGSKSTLAEILGVEKFLAIEIAPSILTRKDTKRLGELLSATRRKGIKNLAYMSWYPLDWMIREGFDNKKFREVLLKIIKQPNTVAYILGAHASENTDPAGVVWETVNGLRELEKEAGVEKRAIVFKPREFRKEPISNPIILLEAVRKVSDNKVGVSASLPVILTLAKEEKLDPITLVSKYFRHNNMALVHWAFYETRKRGKYYEHIDLTHVSNLSDITRSTKLVKQFATQAHVTKEAAKEAGVSYGVGVYFGRKTRPRMRAVLAEKFKELVLVD